MDRLSEAKQKQDMYRPRPFWSWNDHLEEHRLKEQVRAMKRAGLGGFFMHARVGLRTPYFSEEWFNAIRTCIDEAVQLGLEPWGYDENGYPSGIADGIVVRENENWRSTWIEWIPREDLSKHKDKKILAYYLKKKGGYLRVTSDQKADYLLIQKNEMRAADPLNQTAVERFIQLTHERYAKELGNRFGKGGMPGFFTDEPQLKQYQLPWSEHFQEEFQKQYNYDILDRVYCLKEEFEPGYEAVRHDYWMLVHQMYTEHYAKTIFDWCHSHGSQFTGHVMGEDTILEQMGSTGGVMPFYEFMDIPGMDWLGRRIGSPLAPKQVSSVAAQLGKEQVISETFALSGWDVSLEDLKWMAEWQYANGVNLLCPHLESYSIRGIRKRDYPASLFIQEPWWETYHLFTDYISALGAVFSTYKEQVSLLVLHPLHSAHVLYNGCSDSAKVKSLDESFLGLLKLLEKAKIPYHLGDEVILSRHGHVEEDGTLTVGKARYQAVLLPELYNILDSTVTLLEAFVHSGGRVFSTGALPSLINGRPNYRMRDLTTTPLGKEEVETKLQYLRMAIIQEDPSNSGDILYSERAAGQERLLYLFNSSREKSHKLSISLPKAKMLSKLCLPSYVKRRIASQKTAEGITLNCVLKPAESILLIESPHTESIPDGETELVSLPESLTIHSADSNSITLDACRYSINHGPIEAETPVILLQKELLDKKMDSSLDLFFSFRTDFSEPHPIYLVSENLPEFSLSVNGHKVPIAKGYSFLDPDFTKVEITEYVQNGYNEIKLSGRFWQRKELYDYLYRPKDLSSNFYNVDFEFESVTYDTELESLYLLGDFSVESEAPFSYGDRNAVITKGNFLLKDPIIQVQTGDLTTQGLPFFAGKIELEWESLIHLDLTKRYALRMGKPFAPAAILSVNGSDGIPFVFGCEMPDITPFLKDGKNAFRLTLYSGLRNLLGPHHFKFGESYYVGTTTFGKIPGWCEDVMGIREPIWADQWCFVRFGPNVVLRRQQ